MSHVSYATQATSYVTVVEVSVTGLREKSRRNVTWNSPCSCLPRVSSGWIAIAGVGQVKVRGMGRYSAETTDVSRGIRWVYLLTGARYVDLPIRVLLLLVALGGVTPSALESDAPLYLALQLLAAVLVVAAGFIPLLAGASGFMMFLAFTVAFPDLLNPFQTVVEVATAFVLSQLRVRPFVAFTMLLFATKLISHVVGSTEGGSETLVTLAFGWLMSSLLALTAAGFERRIQDGIAKREEIALASERKIERLRLDLALDTHDTISHGLAAEAAIIRMLGIEARMENRHDCRLTELALVNAHARQQLRVLLSRLTQDLEGRSGGDDFETDLLRAAEMTRSATEAGGLDLKINIGDVPTSVPGKTLESALFTMKELATNVVKHASHPRPCIISVSTERREDDDWLRFESQNPSVRAPYKKPRTLLARVQRSGGTCDASCHDGVFTVVVCFPVGREVTM